MNRAMGKWIAVAAVAALMGGCGNAKCESLGKHVAELVFQEAEAAGQAVAAEKRAEVAKKTAEACNAEPPPDKHLDCALSAKSTEAMKKCESDGAEP